uniref:Uncharacterized protein n=1 Tax=Cajanus cajan TaxID=3821 RepID=A0A151R6C5_CAJCA|nr:hypothetical protein KK1_040614 [Cajanus cajan]
MQGNQGWRNNNQDYGWRNEVGPSNRPPPQQQQPHQPAYPSMHERTSKLEDTLNQFMQVSMNNQKNTEASIKNLEVQVGQLAKQLADMSGGPFSANTKTNPKEHCKAITTRNGKVVGANVGVSENNEGAENEGENNEMKEVEEESKKNKGENNKSESVNNEKIREKNEVEKEKNKKKGKEVNSAVPVKNLPYPHAPSKKEKERQFLRFLDIIKKLQINIPFTEAMEQMPTYARFMKELLTKKRRILEEETVELKAGCSAIIQKSLPQKSRDPGSFTLPVSIGNLSVGKALLDLGASINLMPSSMLKKIGEVEVRPTRMTLQLADRSIKLPHGIVEYMIVKVDKFMFPVDFVVMDMEEDLEVPLILGRPFMKTARVIIDMDDGKLKVRVQDEEVNFNVFEAMKFPKGNKDCFRIDVLDDVYLETQSNFKNSSPLEKALSVCDEELDKVIDKEVQDVIDALNKGESLSTNVQSKEELKKEEKDQKVKLELKQLPPQLKYVFLEANDGKPIIISSQLSREQEDKLIQVIKANEGAIGWTLSDLKGISPSYCMHKIHMEQDYKPVAQPQRHLNPTMKEVVRKEVTKLLEAGMIYNEKGGMTVVYNEKNELIPTRTVTGWRMCID